MQRSLLPGALLLFAASSTMRASAQQYEQGAASSSSSTHAHVAERTGAKAGSEVRTEDPVRFTLENGLDVVLARDARSPRVAVTIAYDVGSRDDPPAYRGLAHLVEHLMFEGMAHKHGRGYFELMESAGATVVNAETSFDHTIYYQELPSSHLELALWAEASRMAFLLDWVGEPELQRARAAVTQEWEERVGSGGTRAFLGHVYATLFPQGHPYHAINDDPDDVQATTLQHAQWFFQKHYAPDNATLVLVGAFDPDDARQMIERHFSKIAGKSEPDVAQKNIKLEGQHTLDVRWPFKSQMCMLAWPIANDAAERRALDVLATHLAYELDQLENEKELTSSAAYYDENELAGVFMTRLHLDEEADAQAWLERLDQLLTKMRSAPIPARAVARAKKPWQQAHLFAREDLLFIGSRLGRGLGLDGQSAFEKTAEDYSALTAADLLNAAKKWLPLDRRVVMCTEHRLGAPRTGTLRSHDFEEAKP